MSIYLLAVIVALGATQAPTRPRPIERLSATASSTGGQGLRPVMQTVDITIERWSTERERESLATALKSGQERLVDALQNTPAVGAIVSPGHVAYPLRYAREVRDNGRRRITLATDRPISPWEAREQPPSIDYPLTIITLDLDESGTGTGEMSIATRLVADASGRFVTVEGFTVHPIALNDVKSIVEVRSPR